MIDFLKSFFRGDRAPESVLRKSWDESEVKGLEETAKSLAKQVELTERAVKSIVTIQTSQQKIRAINETGDLVIDEMNKRYGEFNKVDRGKIRGQVKKSVSDDIKAYTEKLRGAAGG